MYINRLIDNDLLAWSKETDHKPVLLRGARQVGKSSSVKNQGFPVVNNRKFRKN